MIEKMINSHVGWDMNVRWPNGGNRHAKELKNLYRSIEKCWEIKIWKCAGPTCGDTCKKAVKTVTTVGGAILFVCGSIFGFGGS